MRGGFGFRKLYADVGVAFARQVTKMFTDLNDDLSTLLDIGVEEGTHDELTAHERPRKAHHERDHVPVHVHDHEHDHERAKELTHEKDHDPTTAAATATPLDDERRYFFPRPATALQPTHQAGCPSDILQVR
eukprot:587743-Prorocentrum_minimum.AAC.2